jgi:hypothetical protein
MSRLKNVNPDDDGADSMCFEDAANGEDEMPLPSGAQQHGDNPKNSSTAKQGNGARLVEGPFGGKSAA